jgi:hypothetical protein
MSGQSTGRLAALVLAAVLAAGCGGVIDPSQNEVEDFPGTIEPLGGVSHQFNVDETGEFDIRITALNNADALLHLAYGPQSGGCNRAIQAESYKRLNEFGFAGFIQPGSYCVYMFDDLGQLRAASPYTLRVSHP